MRKIKGVLITPNNGEMPKVYELEYNSYKDFYPLLDCGTFDVVSRKFDGKWLDIYCDDEGIFKDGNAPSIITVDEDERIIEQIVGNVFIVNHNDDGETISLTNDEVQKVLSNLVMVMSRDGKRHLVSVASI